MPFSVLIFVYRKPGLSPTAFKSHYETSHVPLIKSIAGPLFPNSHTRHYIQRTESNDSSSVEAGADNTKYPAAVLVGNQADVEYDAYAELTFDDEAAFQTFFTHMYQPEAAEKIAQDEELFLNREKMTVVVVGDHFVTTK